MEPTKTCTRCGLEKVRERDFRREAKRRDGRASQCKECDARHRAQHLQRQYEHVAAWRAANPEKFRAQSILGNAVKRGELQRQPCQHCGEPRTHGHHSDYTKPLEVMWLCAVCHKEEHARMAQKALEIS